MRDTLPRIFLRGVNFRGNLPRRQVAHTARLRRGAEPAAHGTPDLGGHTDSIAVFVAHQNSFDAVSVGQLQKVLDRAILGLLAAADGGCGNRTLLLQRGQQGFGLVGHLGKLGHELLMQPFKNLFGAEFRLTQPHDVSCQGVQRHI